MPPLEGGAEASWRPPTGFGAVVVNGTVYLVPIGNSIPGYGLVTANTILEEVAVAPASAVVAPPAAQDAWDVLSEGSVSGPRPGGGSGRQPVGPSVPSSHDSWNQPSPAPAPLPQVAQGSGGGGSSSTASPSSSSSEDETPEGPTEEGYRGVPEGGELWHIDGRVYWGREILDPRTGERVGFAGWHIQTQEDLQTLLGDRPLEFAFDGTIGQAEAQGFLDGGILSEVVDTPGVDPLETFYEDWTEELSLSPMYDDPEIYGLAIVAALEGRTISENELSQTEWWQSQNDAQRAWAELVATNPAQAQIVLDNNREAIRDRFWQAGWSDVPDAMVDRIATQWTSGEMSQADAWRQVQREVDPYAPGASPYAGLTGDALDELGWQVIRSGDDLFIRTPDGDHRVNGPGGLARFSDLAVDASVAPDGQHVLRNGVHYLVTDDGWYEATGAGQIAGLERLYGPAQVGGAISRRPDTVGTVVGLFGGPGGIEQASRINEVGTADVLAGSLSGERDTTGLGQEERVRELLREYVGPYHAGNYSDAWVAQWAGRLRNEGEGTIDLLVQDLQRDFRSLFTGYDGNNLSYESIAGSARGLWSRYSGNEVDESDAEWLRFLGQGPDAVNREGWLRAKGLQDGWAPVGQMAASALQSSFGPQVRGSVV